MCPATVSTFKQQERASEEEKKKGNLCLHFKENLQKFYITLLFTSHCPDLVIPSSKGSREKVLFCLDIVAWPRILLLNKMGLLRKENL